MSERCHGWLKMEFPETSSDPETMRQRILGVLEGLEPTLAQFDIQIAARHPIQTIEDEDCEPFFEINIELESDKFTSSLLTALQKYILTWKESLQYAYQYPTLALHSPDFWRTELKSHQNHVSLGAIYFGNIQGGMFFNHWDISFWEQTQLDLRRPGQELTNSNIVNKIFAEFEFDKTDIMTITFQCMEKDKVDRNRREKKEIRAFYQVGVKRLQINRIIVDPVVSDDYGKERVRVHFDLHSPPLIKRGVFGDEDKRNNFATPLYQRYRTFQCVPLDKKKADQGYPTEEAVTSSSIFTIEFREDVLIDEIYLILSRLRDRTGASIEFSKLLSIDVLIGRKYPYHRWTINNSGVRSPTAEDVTYYKDFIEYIFTPLIKTAGWDVYEERKFAITYLIECLISRGAIVKDQLLLHEIHWSRFLKSVSTAFQHDDKLCESALEDLIHLIDGRKRIGSILKCFDKICQRRQRLQLVNGLTEDEIREGFIRVRKVVMTPTRLILVPPETIMGNRVVRRFDKDGTYIIRGSFRDDNNSQLRVNDKDTKFLDVCVRDRLFDGLSIANRQYGFLGCSNSQMRDNGAYFVLKYMDYQLEQHMRKRSSDARKYSKLPREIRKYLGDFTKCENVPKMMARLGQCFTQSRLSGVILNWIFYLKIGDIEGGKNQLGKAYTFSDGVGLMSPRFAEKVSKTMNFGNSVPSCFQFRFRGMKGIIAMEPLLEEFRRWALVNGRKEGEKRGPKNAFDVDCAFRPSQIKFVTAFNRGEQVEIVKFSSPIPVALNKPFINILDQVSEMQSLKCHQRVTGRIEELMDFQISMFARQMNDELFCRNKLKEFPRRIDVDFLKRPWGFHLANEPFFRSLIKASIKFSITKQIKKEQIAIPKELGRSMLGVVDETGRLQYGQLFVQYTENLANKLPRKMAAKRVCKGTVLLTKNPCIVPGDVRVFEAVDIPELHHMCDVVVFPQSGPRPHPDEMAGSDLDGDEYSVIWDQQLLLERNEEPFDFATEKKLNEKPPAKDEEAVDKMRYFYVDYMKLDSVGTISNNHLFQSDQYGLNAPVCLELARKNCQAVDFTKSGEPPEPLTREWTHDPDTNVFTPPEYSERVPDFHNTNERLPMYVSPRLCGTLFREFKSIDDVIKVSEDRDELLEIVLDESIKVPGYEVFMEDARTNLANYNGQMRTIMETYGIRTEGELFSGCIVEMRNKISDKDQDDMSFFNTSHMIETKMTALFCRFRTRFFEEFGSHRAVLEMMENTYNSENVLQWQATLPLKAEVMQKAAAWYIACYEEAQNTRESRKLSFAWVVYDVIARIKEKKVLEGDEPLEMGKRENPMFTMLEEHRLQYLQDHGEKFQNFLEDLGDSEDEAVQKAIAIINKYNSLNPGLDTVIFMILEWANASDIMTKTTMRLHHLALLFLLFVTRPLPSVASTTMCLLPSEQGNRSDEGHEPLSEMQKSSMMVKFLEYLASREFRRQSRISMKPLGYESVWMRGEWNIFHSTAIKTYYTILFNLRFEELPISTDPGMSTRVLIREDETFIVELPSTFPRHTSIVTVEECMKEHSGVTEIVIRRLQTAGADKRNRNKEEEPLPCHRYLVACRGTLESIQKLRKLVAVRIPLRSHLVGKDITKQMAKMCFTKIMEGFE